MTEEQTVFHNAIEHLYSVFAKYPLRADTECCPCCHEPDAEKKLHGKPLRELDADDLEGYGLSALFTWGTVEDFKHFLPRLFELVAEAGSIGWADAPVIFYKLGYADWRSWPCDEHAAVNNYLIALWRYCINDASHDHGLEEILCGIAQVTDDLTPYLDDWRESGLVGHQWLSAFIIEQYDSIVKKHELFDPFWRNEREAEDDRTTQMNQVIDWLLDKRTYEALEETWFDQSDTALGTDIATALNWLDHLIKLYPPEKNEE